MAKDEETPYWDTAYGTPRPGGGLKKLVLIVAFMGVLGCLGFMVYRFVIKKKGSGQTVADSSGGDGKTKGPVNETKQEKSDELHKLNSMLAKMKSRRKSVASTIESFKTDSKSVRDKLLASKKRYQELKAKTKANPGDGAARSELAHLIKRLKKMIAEKREVDRSVVRLVEKREDFVDHIDDIERTIRQVNRELKAADFLDDTEKDKINTLIAKKEAFMRNQEREESSLQKAIADARAAEPTDTNLDEGALDKAIGN